MEVFARDLTDDADNATNEVKRRKRNRLMFFSAFLLHAHEARGVLLRR